MKTAIIVGSHRKKSQSSKVAAFIDAQIKSIGGNTYVYDLKDNPLPFWDESIWESNPEWQNRWSPIAKELESCDSAVVISPEWAGMVPAGLKNFFLLLGKELAHKPALIVGVSSGRGGSYPIAELRTSSYKNSFITYIPDHVIVRDVEACLNGNEPESEDDKYIRERFHYSLNILKHYSQALKIVRESGDVDFKSYPFGM